MTERQLNSLISSAGSGDQAALNEAWPKLYDELHRIAARHMRKERKGNLLQTTAIVHEAYFRLFDQNQSDWKDRNSFLAAAAVAMRRVLIDNARKTQSQKRGGNLQRVELCESRLPLDENKYRIEEVHQALKTLGEFAPDEAKALELMIFGGMTGEEVAAVMNVSASTIDRRVRSAKAWLRRELSN